MLEHPSQLTLAAIQMALRILESRRARQAPESSEHGRRLAAVKNARNDAA
jgi:hypothetical protein